MTDQVVVPTPQPVSTVVLKDLTVKVSKETDEVMLLFVKLAKTIRAKGDYSVLVGELVVAIDGAGSIPAELKEQLWASVRSVTNRSVDIAEALTAPQVA